MMEWLVHCTLKSMMERLVHVYFEDISSGDNLIHSPDEWILIHKNRRKRLDVALLEGIDLF